MRLALAIAGRSILDLVITTERPPALDTEADQDPQPFGYAVASDHELSYQDPDIHHAE